MPEGEGGGKVEVGKGGGEKERLICGGHIGSSLLSLKPGSRFYTQNRITSFCQKAFVDVNFLTSKCPRPSKGGGRAAESERSSPKRAIKTALFYGDWRPKKGRFGDGAGYPKVGHKNGPFLL